MPSRISMGNLSMEPASRLGFPTLTLVLVLAMTETDVEVVRTMTGIIEAGKYIASSVQKWIKDGSRFLQSF